MAMTQLAGKTALVTGASAGIGRACTIALAQAGARVVAAARREERVEQLCRELSENHAAAMRPLVLDVRSRQAVDAAVGALSEAGWGVIDILVNNAGLAAGLEAIGEGFHEKWDRMIDTNVKGLLNVSRAIIPGMIERGGGHIVNIGSVAGREVYPNGNVYCATKFAVRALNSAMRIDLLGKGIRVTSVDPGMVRTEFSLVRFEGDAVRADQPYAGMTPLSAEDVADAVLWAVTRPAHVNVQEILLLPTDQATATRVHRKGL